MSVHISFNPVGSNPVQSTKASEAPAIAGASFSNVLSNASEVQVKQPTQTGSEAGGASKKAPKKTDNARSDATDGGQSNVAALLLLQVLPPVNTPVLAPNAASTQAGDRVVENTANGDASLPVGGMVGNETATLPTASELLIPVNAGAALPSGEAPASAKGDTDGGAPVSNDAPPSDVASIDAGSAVSGARLGTSDEAWAPTIGVPAAVPPVIQPLVPPVVDVAQAVAVSPVSSKEPDATAAVKDDDGEAAPVSLPVLPDALTQAGVDSQQSAVVNVPTPLDLSVLAGADKGAAASAEGSVTPVKPAPMSGKDHGAPELRERRKVEATDNGTQAPMTGADASAKSLQASGGTAHQGAEGQAGSKDVPSLQAATTVVPAPIAGAQFAPHPSVPSAQGAETPTQPQSPLPAALEAHAMPEMSSARLIQSIHQSEMKLGMNSTEFGNISISTSVTHQALSAQISLDHSELGRALAAHLPAMEERLGNAYGLQARVELRDGGAASFGGSSQGSNDDRQNAQGRRTTSAGVNSFSSGITVAATNRSSIPVVAETERLDIRI